MRLRQARSPGAAASTLCTQKQPPCPSLTKCSPRAGLGWVAQYHASDGGNHYIGAFHSEGDTRAAYQQYVLRREADKALQRSARQVASEQGVLPWLRDQQSLEYGRSPPFAGSPQPQQQPRAPAPLVLGGRLAGVDGLEGLGTDLGSFRAEDNIERFISEDIDQARERGGGRTRCGCEDAARSAGAWASARGHAGAAPHCGFCRNRGPGLVVYDAGTAGAKRQPRQPEARRAAWRAL